MPCLVRPPARVRPRSRLHRTRQALIALAAASALSVSARPATAQMIVHDPGAYAKLIEQAETQLKQLDQLRAQVDQAKQLYDGFNRASGVNSLAQVLSSPALRDILPDAGKYLDAAKGDLASLGQIGQRAAEIRKQTQIFRASIEDPNGQALNAAGDRAARDLALGQTVADAAAQRLKGLQQLQAALDTAPTARAAMDLQARLSAEQAMIANDQLRLQGLAIAQAAEQRMAFQREKERVAASDAARMKAWRSLFQ